MGTERSLVPSVSHVHQGRLAHWFVAQKRGPTEPPYEYEIRRGQLDDGPLLIHRRSRICVWPHALRLGTSLRDEYLVLYYYAGKHGAKRLLEAGSPGALWRALLQLGADRTPGLVLACSLEPDEWAQRGSRPFWSGQLLLAKAKIIHYSKGDMNRFEFAGDTPADWCVPLRVPAEWTRPAEQGFCFIAPEQLERSDATAGLDDQLFQAVQRNAVDEVHALIEHSANPNARNRTGWQPLLVAAAAGHAATCRELVRSAADVGARNSFGGRPLALAVMRGNVDVLSCLLEAKADVDEQDQWRDAPLHLAAKGGHARACEVLIEHKADVWARNVYGDLPCDVCKVRGFAALATRLKDAMSQRTTPLEVPYPLPKSVSFTSLR